MQGSSLKTLKQRILYLVSLQPGSTDRQITDDLLGKGVGQQAVNQAARQLALTGHLLRQKRKNGRIGNYPRGTAPSLADPAVEPITDVKTFLSEDDTKRKVQAWLERRGWELKITWGRGHGIDMEARRSKVRWVIEVKGQGTLNAMRVNFFLGVLGELLQRMDDPKARYSLAVPDLPQYRRLWERLPRLAKKRTRISALFVTHSGTVEEVR